MGFSGLLIAQSAGGLIGLAIAALVGAAAGFAVCFWLERSAASSRRAAVEREIEALRRKSEDGIRAAEVESQRRALELKERFERETAETREELKNVERRLAKREDSLDKKLDVLNTKERKIDELEQLLARRQQELEEKQKAVEKLQAEQRSELLRISKLTVEEARTLCLQRIEQELEREAGQMVDRILGEAQENAKERARKITIEAIQRYASEHTCESTVATVDVPNDEMKGRVIGREGRNIRAFERVTGATVIVDDTPGVVSVTCFDPVRKEVSRLTLERLIKDGRIHPARIEELHAEVTKEIEQRVVEAGKHAALEANVAGLNRKILDTLGALQYRTSYGQNVLRHSIEVAFLCGVMADELGLDGALARRCGLLHDIGKAIAHEGEGTHTAVGAEFVKKFNERPEVINAVEGHHGDVPSLFVYTPLVTAADAMSASRPGGRRESLEKYIKRLEELEAIATSFKGVRQAFAIEAGREVRVIVDAVQVDDRSTLKLARDIAQRIQDTMMYPGEIKITVLRELRAVEYAR